MGTSAPEETVPTAARTNAPFGKTYGEKSVLPQSSVVTFSWTVTSGSSSNFTVTSTLWAVLEVKPRRWMSSTQKAGLSYGEKVTVTVCGGSAGQEDLHVPCFWPAARLQAPDRHCPCLVHFLPLGL